MLIKHEDVEFDIHVEGWDKMLQSPKTRSRALTLQALCNLELGTALGASPPPTQQAILEEVRRLQKKMGVKQLGPNSIYQIERNIKSLLKDKHIFYKEGIPPKKRKVGRGGPSSPWASRYVYPLIHEMLTK